MDGHEREPSGRSALPLLLAVLIATVLPLTAAGREAPRADDYDRPSPGWREGPVRYLLSKDEDDGFRTLATETERGSFILTFWSNRDPRPTSPENEYRDLFYRRVTEANRLFVESPKAGWKTDRGKIYILLGPPDEVEQVGDPIFGREAFLWTYRNPPAGSGLGARAAIRFAKDATGEFQLTSDLHGSAPSESSLGLGFQVQAMQMKSLPPPRVVLDRIVKARSFLDSAPFRTHRDFYRSVDGNSFLALTVGLKQSLAGTGFPSAPELAADAADSVEGRFEVLARLVGDDPSLPTYDLAGANGLRAAGHESPAGEDAYLLYQGIATVKPGRYNAYYGVVDRSTQQVYSFKETIAVPDLKSTSLSLSSVTLASRLERVTDPSATGYTTPFVLGNLRVLPRPDDVFKNGETLAFYYQIYSAATDPIDGRPDLDVEYQFSVARGVDAAGQPTFEPLGKPIRLTRQQNQVQGYSFPLKDWPAATYRLEVSVTDTLNGRRSSRDVTFRVL